MGMQKNTHTDIQDVSRLIKEVRIKIFHTKKLKYNDICIL